MRRLITLSFALASALVVAPAAAGQEPEPPNEYCDSVCMLPQLPPPECLCGILGGGAGGGGGAPGGGPPTAAEILDDLQAAYEARVAGVDDYTMVVQPRAAPMPVVQYFEKEMIDGTPMFRQLSPAEIAERQAEETGQPTPQEIGGGLEALAGAMGGLDPPAGAPAGSQSVLDLLAGGVRGAARILQNAGPLETRQDLFDRLYNFREFRDRAELIGRDTLTWSECGETWPCGEEGRPLRLPVEVLQADGLEDVDLGEGSEGYELKEVTYWVYNDDYNSMPMKMRAVLAQGARRVAVQRTIHQHIRAQRMLEPGYFEDAMVSTMIQNPEWATLFITAAHRMATIVHLLRLNEGPPTDEEMARLIGLAMGAEN